MKLFKKIYENSIDDFFNNDVQEEDTYYEGSYNFNLKIIDDWIKNNCRIKGQYEIDDNSFINVYGDIVIYNKELEEFPNYIQFNKIYGNYNCSYMKLLKSLKGCPKYVERDFNCRHCLSLKSLKDISKNIKGDLDISFCISLKSLEGCPTKLKNFICNYCNSLKTLKGGPEYIEKDFDCSGCESLESFEGAPKCIERNFISYKNESLISNELPANTTVKGKILISNY